MLPQVAERPPVGVNNRRVPTAGAGCYPRTWPSGFIDKDSAARTSAMPYSHTIIVGTVQYRVVATAHGLNY